MYRPEEEKKARAENHGCRRWRGDMIGVFVFLLFSSFLFFSFHKSSQTGGGAKSSTANVGLQNEMRFERNPNPAAALLCSGLWTSQHGSFASRDCPNSPDQFSERQSVPTEIYRVVYRVRVPVCTLI